MHFAPSPSRALRGISGRRVLTPHGVGPACLAFDEAGRIAHMDATDVARDQDFDAGDLLVVPGIVDLHGDAFERAIMPRPRVIFPYDGALLDVDRQLLANGITTEFHGVTLSWEGGLRGEPYAVRMFDALDRMRGLLGAHHYVHLRFETHHIAGVDVAQSWIREGKVRFLALNDHLPSMAKRLGDDRKLLQYAERAECDLDTFQDRIRAAMASADDVAGAMRELTRSAHEAGLQVASHDDGDAATRRYYHQLGCKVAEFPVALDAAQVARSLGDAIVFGAPNVVRGGSHNGSLNATEMIGAGLCDVLASDYYYPAPLAAALKLAHAGTLPLDRAWDLVSRNPARAAGLRDRGQLAPGMSADAIVVDDSVPEVPHVCAAIVGGRLRYATRQFESRLARAAA
ncbi:alpha-D-ribose 1-methylphosphonate 5-triphosphate diphosphatase [Bordetella genomosp. 9]|uniref:alpha-D-ribose 1-methylphosphonate 5-triphosphate diphosphatase n=1 Tax=Bordetella genomosp. 9 TaxID=1416803 RepID=UPI000A2979BC|nr:alpha-D-ribose 1-methylphosphonate 5-triphosphate diphosphatase [Bordetella genomosp. 9]ARP91704.1 alpha-D-ribose 1-methylphosphonate 5-triphosphate diphosphatase [Bordetella genomosp. 9]